jgi:hypothetical protein
LFYVFCSCFVFVLFFVFCVFCFFVLPLLLHVLLDVDLGLVHTFIIYVPTRTCTHKHIHMATTRQQRHNTSIANASQLARQ